MLMNKRIRVITTALATILMLSTPVLASPDANNEASQVQSTNGSQATQVQNTNNISMDAQIQNLEKNVEMLDSQIEQTLINIDTNKNEIIKTENDIKKLQDQVSYTENDIKSNKTVFDKRARVFYMNGIDGYMQLIMDSKNFGDFVSRVDSVKRIINFDEGIMSDLNNKKQNIVAQKEKLQDENKKLLVLKDDNEKKLVSLNENKDTEKKVLDQLQIQQKIIAQDASQAINSNITLSSVSLDSLPSKDNDVVAYSYKFLGIPYLWGGTTPDGFDCSGFVQYVYAHAGVSIGRTTYDQIKDGTEVSRDKLQPGDLIFFGTKEDPHHVGMYIGNGMYIHAPHTGDVIKISALSGRNDYLTARRVK